MQDESFPSLSRIEEHARERGIIGGRGHRRGARESNKGSDYLYIKFVKEVGEEVSVLNDRDEIIEERQYVARVMRFLLLDNGNYAFSSRRGVNDYDALSYLFEPVNTQYDYDRYEEFSLKQMRWFYKNREKIRKVKVEEIGEKEPNPTWPDDDVIEVVDDTGREADNSIFSVGHKDNNLKNVEIINRGFARLSDLSFIRAKDGEGNIQELIDSGRFGFTYSSDVDEDEESLLIRDTAIGLLRSLFGDIEDDEDE